MNYFETFAQELADAAEANFEMIDSMFPGWEAREQDPERFVSEADMERADQTHLAVPPLPEHVTV